MKPSISFVLPSYNRVAWVGEAIQSLLDGTEKNIEVIVVDDGSTDGTREFLEDYKKTDPRIKVVYNEKNLGAGKSRNIGMNLAEADIIGVCDSDDVNPKDRAEVTLRWFKEHPESELVNFPYMRIGYFCEPLEMFWGSEFDEKSFKENKAVSYFCNPSVAYKKSSGVEVGGYPPETESKTDDIQFVENWIEKGKKIDFDNRAVGVLHRVLKDSMMAKQRGWSPKWVQKGEV